MSVDGLRCTALVNGHFCGAAVGRIAGPVLRVECVKGHSLKRQLEDAHKAGRPNSLVAMERAREQGVASFRKTVTG